MRICNKTRPIPARIAIRCSCSYDMASLVSVSRMELVPSVYSAVRSFTYPREISSPIYTPRLPFDSPYFAACSKSKFPMKSSTSLYGLRNLIVRLRNTLSFFMAGFYHWQTVGASAEIERGCMNKEDKDYINSALLAGFALGTSIFSLVLIVVVLIIRVAML